MLKIEPPASNMLGELCTTETFPQPSLQTFEEWVTGCDFGEMLLLGSQACVTWDHACATGSVFTRMPPNLSLLPPFQ